MLKFAKVLTGIVMALLVFLLVALYGVHLQTAILRFEAEAGSDKADLTSQLLQTARQNDMGANRFMQPTSTDVSDYQLIHIAVQARNVGILPAEWLQLHISPKQGDVALFSGGETDVPPLRGTRKIEVTLLTDASADAASRDIRLSYYVFGRALEIAVR